jgi:LmbE family N-acetylglucosaminyl deacetylase
VIASPFDPPVSNAARFAARPLPGAGTPAHVWLSARRKLPVLDLSACPEIVVVGAHPDDETLGFGATSAMLADTGVRVQVVSASDGGASHPGLSPLERGRLEHVRRAELQRAVNTLGLLEPISLGLPDGQIEEHEDRLADVLAEILAARPAGTWCAATWCGDGHPDHEAVGRAAAVAVERVGAELLEYPVWMWHWAYPDDAAVPWQRAYEVPLSHESLIRKRAAVQSFYSQFGPGTFGVAAPVMPPAVLHRLLAVGEVVFR